MKIAVIGIGNVGGTLGVRWAKGGHDVVFGTRDPQSQKSKSLVKLTDNRARAAAVADAAGHAEVVVLATPWPATRDAIRSAGNLAGKIVIDCTNPIDERLKLAQGHTTSGGEQVAAWVKNARVVKAFNTTGFNVMAHPVFGDRKATMFICGDDTPAKETVARLADELDFEACDSGPMYMARYLEPLAMLWINLAHVQGLGREIAFHVLKR